MKKLTLVLMLAIFLAGGAIGGMSAPAHAQYGYTYPPPPLANPYGQPWVGPNTPWTFYNGDWFLQGVLYYFFGNQYGWAPYYAYPSIYIVRPYTWYEPKWYTWYQRNPHYWKNFRRHYPYWAGHREGHHYDQGFYEKHHHGQGAGWQKGFRGVGPKDQPHPGRLGPGPTQVAPPQGPKTLPAQQQQQWQHRPREQQLQQQPKQLQMQQQSAPQLQQPMSQQQIQRTPQPQLQQQQRQREQQLQQYQKQPKPQQEKKVLPQPGQP